MKRVCVLCALVLCASPVFAREMIAYERFTLSNGLRVIVHEDRKAPIVALRVAYHVGAKDEPAGRKGFAHLFEHLMFRGSENFKGDFWQAFDNVGVTDMNGVTTQDTTQYFETVPTPALEFALWLESDRMGHLLGNLTEEALKAERAIVQNEKRDREGGPLGPVNARVSEALFPAGHPYRHSVLGSMEDLDAASVQDVREWFGKYYGPTNAIVVLAGDIDVQQARTLTEKYFGDIPPGEPLHRMNAWVPQLPVIVRESMQARLSQMSVRRSWPVPGPDTRDHTLLNIVARILAGTLKERLWGELVEKRKLATGVSTGIEAYEIASVFSMSADVKTDEDVTTVMQVMDAELERFLKSGPTAMELQKIKSGLEAFQVLGMQNVSARAFVLAEAELATGNPGFNEIALQWIQQATVQDLRQVATEWLARPYYQLTIHPFGEFQASPAKVDRSVMPSVVDDLQLDLPPIQEATLSNGIKLVLAERHDVAALAMKMVFEGAGNGADIDGMRGTAEAVYALMNDGPAKLSKADYVAQLEKLHATTNVSAGLRDAVWNLSVLKKNLRPALRLWQQALRDPAFRQADLDLWREGALRNIAAERLDPESVAIRTLRTALYPAGHALAPSSEAEREALVKAIASRDLRAFHARWLRPDIAKLFVVGDTTLPEITRELEQVFRAWKAPATAVPAAPAIAATPLPSQPRFILVDWPGEAQVQMLAGRFVMPAGSDEARLLTAANAILGVGASARLGQRLRVEKGWSYGISSGPDGGLRQQYWGLSSSVQKDAAAQSVAEILDVIRNFTGPSPATDAELARFVKSRSRSLPGTFEDLGSVLQSMAQSDAHGRPYDWAEGARKRLHALDLEDVNRLARECFTPESFTWVLVGDLSSFEQKLRDLDLGTVEVWDRQGIELR